MGFAKTQTTDFSDYYNGKLNELIEPCYALEPQSARNPEGLLVKNKHVSIGDNPDESKRIFVVFWGQLLAILRRLNGLQLQRVKLPTILYCMPSGRLWV